MRPIEDLLEDIEADARATGWRTGRMAISPRVMEAIRATDRAAFMPADTAALANRNAAQRIGHGQTISQPFIVALMTDLLELAPASRVLEVGTGSGYQAAILARLARAVVSIETIPALSELAGAALAATGVDNVRLIVGDGAQGWLEGAPYDRIIVTAAAREVPPALLSQLAALGRMVIPLGSPHGDQSLHLIERDPDGALHERDVLDVAFVPLVSKAGKR